MIIDCRKQIGLPVTGNNVQICHFTMCFVFWQPNCQRGSFAHPAIMKAETGRKMYKYFVSGSHTVK